MTKAVLFFYRYLYRLVPVWYGFTMLLTRFRRWPPLPWFQNSGEIVEMLKGGENWRPDPLRGVLDVMMDPRKFQSRIDNDEKEFGDCDDYAIYWCTALLQSELAEKVWMATVWYGKPGERDQGHVVCVFSKDGMQYWCDYRTPRITTETWDWAKDCAEGRGKIAKAAGMTEVQLRRSGNPKFKALRAKSIVF